MNSPAQSRRCVEVRDPAYYRELIRGRIETADGITLDVTEEGGRVEVSWSRDAFGLNDALVLISARAALDRLLALCSYRLIGDWTMPKVGCD